MFLVNSRYRHFSEAHFCFGREVLHIYWAHLLPKLRCYFAEFLNQGSLKRLRIFFLPTCVGLRYDHLIISLEAFLGSMGSITLCTKCSSSHLSLRRTDLPVPPTYMLKPPSNRWLIYPAASLHHSNDYTVVKEY